MLHGGGASQSRLLDCAAGAETGAEDGGAPASDVFETANLVAFVRRCLAGLDTAADREVAAGGASAMPRAAAPPLPQPAPCPLAAQSSNGAGPS